ncbi:MAG TPA: aspartyl/asparaginyl beta-hydroxylase domain-containing protein [Caulobacteraceae bacterium]|nr:aspartyl/asparaginyl beta-hydroxylase domain-containing protein [Caulobacteraceae bacterium]
MGATSIRTPAELIRLGAGALLRDPAEARGMFEEATRQTPADPGAWYGLAAACGRLGDHEAAQAALDRTLEIDPNHLPALLKKADYFAALGDRRAAAAFYQAAVNRAPPREGLPSNLRTEVARAERLGGEYAKAFEDHLEAGLRQVGYDPRASSRRFAQGLDILLGRRRLYGQSPSAFFFPELPQRQFYERQEFPWLAELEARTAEIRNELLAVVREDRGLKPYVRSSAERPPKSFGGLADNPDWSAFFLIEDGRTMADNATRCPATMAALAPVPLASTPGRTPSVLFSLLKPGTRIPPHTGMVNTRLICHLPLIVPPGCALRVGNETRPWRIGECLIFDDTFEHEAWNDSDELRAVLLFDIWRPELSLEERELASALLMAVSSFGAETGLDAR